MCSVVRTHALDELLVAQQVEAVELRADRRAEQVRVVQETVHLFFSMKMVLRLSTSVGESVAWAERDGSDAARVCSRKVRAAQSALVLGKRRWRL